MGSDHNNRALRQTYEKKLRTGFAGRIGIFELLVPDESILAAIARSATLQELQELMTQNGFVTLQADGMEKVRGGMTTAEEVFYVTSM